MKIRLGIIFVGLCGGGGGTQTPVENNAGILHSVCLSVCFFLFVCLPVWLFVCLPVSISVCLSLSLCLSVFLFVCLSFCLLVCLSLSVCIPACLSLCLSFCLSVWDALGCPGLVGWLLPWAALGCLGLPWAAPGCPWAALGWLAGHNPFYGDYHDLSVLELVVFQRIYMNLLWAALGCPGVLWAALGASGSCLGLHWAAPGCPGLPWAGWLAGKWISMIFN